jgi:hypothetical protein
MSAYCWMPIAPEIPPCTLTVYNSFVLWACSLTVITSQASAPEVLSSGAAVLRVPQPLQGVHGRHGDAALSLRRVNVARHPAAQFTRISCSVSWMLNEHVEVGPPQGQLGSIWP